METFHEYVNILLVQYGSIALFVLLALGIIALPVPEETLMIFSGILIGKGILPPMSTIAAAYLGSICGITVSYIIGLTGGLYIIKKYGGYLGVTEAKLKQAHEWFERFGKWMLFIGYFIPGLRHFTGVIAGVTYLEYKHFALFAYAGALFWASTFIAIGYFFGNCCESIYETLENNIEIILSIGVVAILAYIWIKVRKSS